MKEQQLAKGVLSWNSLKFSALLAGGLALCGLTGGVSQAGNSDDPSSFWPSHYKANKYSYFDKLPKFTPGTPLDPNEMRITFLGSMIPPVRRVQKEMSIYVQVGWQVDAQGNGKPLDSFVFDAGSGVCSNYGAMGIGYDKMDKVFLCHLHGDHMSDVTQIYCFGPAGGRYYPLFVWGPSPSGIAYTDKEGKSYPLYQDGTKTFCELIRKSSRWHSESFSFQNTSYAGYQYPTKEGWGLPCEPIPVGEGTSEADPRNDSYALVPIELDWTKNGSGTNPDGTPDNIAYWNKDTGVKITHFPVIHCRKGSIGYKLEWKNPNDASAPVRTMIYTSDTRPEQESINQASNGGMGVDVFIHEMVIPPSVWAFKNLGLSAPPPVGSKYYDSYVTMTNQLQMVQNSSHTPQGAFGYLLKQISPRPKLTVPTHFPVADDTVNCAYNSVLAHCPDIGKIGENIVWSFDLMVLRVDGTKIQQLRAVVNDFGFVPPWVTPPGLNPAKYWTYKVNSYGKILDDANGNPIKTGDPLVQINWEEVIPATTNSGQENYREDGY